MMWTVVFHEDFEPEFDDLSEEVQDELLAEAKFVEKFGPETGRPHVDKLKGSTFANMKELRFEADDGEWRVAFAFDPKRRAILRCRRQTRREPEKVLQAADRKGGF